MAVSLYRQGTSHTIRGVVCEMGTFHHEDLKTQLNNGWFKTPGEAYAMPEAVLESGEKEDEEKEEILNFDGMENDDIRELAKESGIEDWDKKRIKTLKSELANGNG